ncbi:MAG: NAD-dependent DNA ligase LigA, partial [Candidatus Paceibacterota bacterium]
MTKKEAQERIEKLKETINRNRYQVHVLDKEEMPAEVLDSLKHELFLLEQQYPDLITSDSPTQRVAGKPLDKFGKIE